MKKHPLPNCIQTSDCPHLYGISVASHTPGDYAAHRHTFYEFDYIWEGEINICLNGEYHTLHAGDLVFLTPVDLHSYEKIPQKQVRTITIHWLDRNLPKELSLSAQKAGILSCDSTLTNALIQLKQEFDSSEDVLSYPALQNLLERVVILFLRRTKTTAKTSLPEEISYAISYISNHFQAPLTLSQISGVCGYSPSYFCRQFKAYFGMSFGEYLTKTRLSYAATLLASQSISVTDLCFECGFNSVRNFSRAFSKEYGCSPSDFAKRSKSAL